jgi:hypothetical protein
MTEMIEPLPAAIDQEQLARELVERARTEGVELVGPGGLLTGLTKTVPVVGSFMARPRLGAR